MNLRRFSSPLLQKAWIPYFILIFTLAISVFTMYFAGVETRQNDELRFRNIVERTQGSFSNQLATYIALLEGTSGLFAASTSVTNNEFAVYVDRLNIRQQYPGIQGIGYVLLIPETQTYALVESVQAEGISNYQIWPEEGMTERAPIVYIEPLDEKNRIALGYDMFTEPIRREAMLKAAREGGPVMSQKVKLVQQDANDPQAGFLIFLPVYRGGIIPPTPDARLAQLQGFVYSPFRADDLLRGILGAEKSPQIDFRVYDGEVKDENLLHDSQRFGPFSPQSYSPRFRDFQSIEIAGRTWTIEYMTNEAFDAASDVWLVPFVLIFGLLTSGVLFILSQAQYEAGRMAEESESNLHYIAEAGKILASSLDYKRTIATVAKMGIKHMADWCSVDLIKGENVDLIALAHRDQEKIKWAKKYRSQRPPVMASKSGLAQVLKTGKAELYTKVTDRMLRSAADTEEDYQLAKSLGIHSVMIVPLKIHRRTIGAMTYISGKKNRRFTQMHLAIAEEIAQRAAMAIEHARLFQESEQAVQMRDNFISVASHELKTPVTSLKMYLQVMQKQLRKKGEYDLESALTKMDAQVNKLTNLISDLLNVSRIQLGRLEFHDEYFSVANTVQEVVESVAPTSKKHKIHISGTIQKKIYGDRDRIGQVLTNLLTNAIKYSPHADQIDIFLLEDKDTVSVQVRDYGIGIDEKHIGKIFNRFYRVSDTNEKTFPGLGIGLFISHEIITRHGGTLSVTSEKGKGSTFGFVLPKKKLRRS